MDNSPKQIIARLQKQLFETTNPTERRSIVAAINRIKERQ